MELIQMPPAPAPAPPGLLPRKARDFWPLVAIFAAVALLFAAGGWWWLSAEYRRNRAAKIEELAAIAGMKTGQIVAWREQHISNLRVTSSSPTLAVGFAGLVRSPRNPARRAEMEEWLRNYIPARQYASGIFLDAAGKPIAGWVVAAGNPVPEPFEGRSTAQLVARAASTGSFAISDLRRGASGEAEMDFCAPLFATGQGKRPLGFIYFRQDPARFLFPLVQSWPTPSGSAETLLVRREGEIGRAHV
jgi:hypothetical protein